jgi:geranylgeranyl pyrophosphate synthase
MAILAGDALLTHAFEIAAFHPRGPRMMARKVAAIGLLARAAGVTGMIGGQVMDLEAEGRRYSYRTLKRIHRGKTGSLISAAAQIGGVLAGARPDQMGALRRYGDAVGLAFQIVDDILDLEGSSDRLGKTAGKDARARKATFPALLGIAASRRRAERACREATTAIAPLGARGEPLLAIARFIVDRPS